MTLDELTPATRARIERSWLDPEMTLGMLRERFRVHRSVFAQLAKQLGPKPSRINISNHRRTRRQARQAGAVNRGKST